MFQQSLNTLHDYIKKTWHLDIWGFVVNPHFSDSVGTWVSCSRCDRILQWLEEQPNVGTTGHGAEPHRSHRWLLWWVQRSIKRCFFCCSRCFQKLTLFFDPPSKKKQSFRWTVFNLFFRFSSCLKKLRIFCWQIWPPSKKNQPFFKTGADNPPTFATFSIPFSMRCHSPGGGLAAASGAPILGPLAGWGVGACWGQVARGHCLQTWLAPSIARKPRKSQQNWGRKKRLGRTYDWQIWGLMDAFKWQKA